MIVKIFIVLALKWFDWIIQIIDNIHVLSKYELGHEKRSSHSIFPYVKLLKNKKNAISGY